jgi:hypothetical protein
MTDAQKAKNLVDLCERQVKALKSAGFEADTELISGKPPKY